MIMTAAYSHELPRYGLKTGLTNYAACYATGLLLARRHLTKLNLAEKYQGKTEVTGEDWSYNLDEIEGPKPFKATLDSGLARTSTGAKLFASLKGACDGGLDIPHSDTRFAGYSAEKKKLNAEVFRKYIFGGHVADYMKQLAEENPEKYAKQFSQYIKNGVKPEDVKTLYENVHKAIRANPAHQKKVSIHTPTLLSLSFFFESSYNICILCFQAAPAQPVVAKRWAPAKRSLKQRQARVAQKKASHAKKLEA
jgi:large subunit ribosomal protein L5e